MIARGQNGLILQDGERTWMARRLLYKIEMGSNGIYRSLDTSFRQCVLGSESVFHPLLSSTLKTSLSAQRSKQYNFGYVQGLNHSGPSLLKIPSGSMMWKDCRDGADAA